MNHTDPKQANPILWSLLIFMTIVASDAFARRVTDTHVCKVSKTTVSSNPTRNYFLTDEVKIWIEDYTFDSPKILPKLTTYSRTASELSANLLISDSRYIFLQDKNALSEWFDIKVFKPLYYNTNSAGHVYVWSFVGKPAYVRKDGAGFAEFGKWIEFIFSFDETKDRLIEIRRASDLSEYPVTVTEQQRLYECVDLEDREEFIK